MTRKPWVLAKEEGREAEVHAVCSVGINLFRVLMTYLKPVLPAMADKAEAFLNCSLDWTALEAPLLATAGQIQTADDPDRSQTGGGHGRGQQGGPGSRSSQQAPKPQKPETATPSNSRILPRLTCALRRSSQQSMWRAPTNCCA